MKAGSRRVPVSLLIVTALCARMAAAAAPATAPSDHAAAPTSHAATPSGQAVYEHWCAPCHAPGPGHPGTQSLQIKYAGKTPPVLLDRTDLSPQAVAVFVRQGILSMAPFRKTEITDAQLSALTAFVARNFKAN